jgi:hypothetical protein
VNTHADVHAAAALDLIGGMLGAEQFPATAVGETGWIVALRFWCVCFAR